LLRCPVQPYFIRKPGAKVERKFSTTKYATREEASSYEAAELAWKEIKPRPKAKNRTPFETPGKGQSDPSEISRTVLSKEPRATEKQQQQQQMRRSTAPRSLPGDLQADAMQVLETQEQRSVRMAAEGQKQRQREKQKESNQRGAKRLAIKREQNAQLQLAQDMNDRQLQIEELREVLDNGKFDLLLHQDGMPVRKEDLTEAGLRQFYKQCSSVNSYYKQIQ
jgi:hypothetical protein